MLKIQAGFYCWYGANQQDLCPGPINVNDYPIETQR